MPWQLFLALSIGVLVVLLGLRVPVAISLFAVSLLGAVHLHGLPAALDLANTSIVRGLVSFGLTPVPLFVLLGELLFRTGLARRAIDALDGCLGRIPGRLAMLSTGAGGVLGVVSGSPMATTAVLGKSLVPMMEEKGYPMPLATGSVLAAGGLSMILPPSTIAVIWATTAGVPVGPILIAGLVPGILMAINYTAVSTVWGRLAGTASDDATPDRTGRLRALMVDVAPLGIVVFMVVGLIIIGVATPTESAAMGVLGAVVLAVLKRVLTVEIVRESLRSTVVIVSMLLFIVSAAGLFSQVVAASGATRGVVSSMTEMVHSPTAALVLMLLLTVFLGFFLETVATILVTLPFFMPIVDANAIDPLVFGICMLIALQVGLTTPPFGMSIFMLKGVMRPDVRIQSLYRGVAPYVSADVATLLLLVALPVLVTWLPSIVFN